MTGQGRSPSFIYIRINQRNLTGCHLRVTMLLCSTSWHTYICVRIQRPCTLPYYIVREKVLAFTIHFPIDGFRQRSSSQCITLSKEVGRDLLGLLRYFPQSTTCHVMSIYFIYSQQAVQIYILKHLNLRYHYVYFTGETFN